MENKQASFISTQVSAGEYYYLNLTPDKESPETVVCGGREQCAPSYRIERNSFKFYSIEFVSSGRGTLTMNGKRYPLRPGAIYCYGPRTKHSIETDPEAPMLKHFVDFTGNALVDLLKTTSFLNGRPLYASRPFRIRNIFENLITTGNTESRNRDALCCLLLRQLVLYADDFAMNSDAAFSPPGKPICAVANTSNATISRSSPFRMPPQNASSTKHTSLACSNASPTKHPSNCLPG